MTTSASTPISRTTRLRRWGLYLLGSSFLFLLQDWLHLPEWLWSAVVFGCGILAYDWLWPPTAAQGKSALRRLGEFLLALLLLMIAAGLVVWAGVALGIAPNLAIAVTLAGLGLILLAASAISSKG